MIDMKLFPELEKRYTADQYSAREAQRFAEMIAFGPIVFQASRLMVKYGILDAIRDSADGLTMDEVASKTGLDAYTVKCLMEASLCIGTILVNPETDKFTLSKVGWFLLTDEANKVNMDFNHDVNYEGFFRLDESFKEHRPAGLEHFGDWNTIYEGLSSLPEQVQKSWFAFDHFYSDNSFSKALEVVFDRPVKNLLDVGGNTGKWALQCVGHDPEVHVTILDLPQQIELMKKATAGKSQFLDCFSEEEILSILKRAADILGPDSRLCIMELLWNRQRFEPAAFCLTMTSLYFTAMANGNSKMYYSEDLIALIEKAGMEVETIIDGIGQGHNILVCKKKEKQSHMIKEEIIAKVNGFLVDEFEIEESLLEEGASLKKDLGIDSLDIVDIIVLIDKEFGVKVKSEELAKLATLADLYAFIQAKTE